MSSSLKKIVKKQYNKITDLTREQLIKCVSQNNLSLEDTAKKLGIKLTTAKAIYKVYLKEGRTSKKKFKEKKPI